MLRRPATSVYGCGALLEASAPQGRPASRARRDRAAFMTAMPMTRDASFRDCRGRMPAFTLSAIFSSRSSVKQISEKRQRAVLPFIAWRTARHHAIIASHHGYASRRFPGRNISVTSPRQPLIHWSVIVAGRVEVQLPSQARQQLSAHGI